jgi:hypothetical protein
LLRKFSQLDIDFFRGGVHGIPAGFTIERIGMARRTKAGISEPKHVSGIANLVYCTNLVFVVQILEEARTSRAVPPATSEEPVEFRYRVRSLTVAVQ